MVLAPAFFYLTSSINPEDYSQRISRVFALVSRYSFEPPPSWLGNHGRFEI